ncbi:hypothetical protein Sjap_012711 [Stephania japonica]|uniref:Uncharacterized protein n=1 Tax=Stephania japonica TaxID=461633 RepID=A0AAP0IWK7_9MAGN
MTSNQEIEGLGSIAVNTVEIEAQLHLQSSDHHGMILVSNVLMVSAESSTCRSGKEKIDDYL